ncbi:MAG: 2,3-bisphosphoglycerate-independent phosphoglycerate mutase, partial [Flavobacteriales bacterium]|nr:2,3-bisphosphoglycerate-independent phosphoglycerate mutase [Flavobacteriales bacterium]
MTTKCMLVILDGWGHGKKDESDAIFKAKTPFVDSLYEKWSNAELRTDGENVGLPDGQMGNSEVGHMNIGAGRIVFQDLLRINNEIKSGEFFQNPALKSLFEKAASTKQKVHFMGLLGDGGVHAHQTHLNALVDMAENYSISNYFVHAFTDGRDTDPRSATSNVEDLQNHLEGKAGKIASVIGRYFAMDRDNRWERVAKAYHLLVNGQGEAFDDALKAVEESYQNGITDEFIEPKTIVDEGGNPIARIEKGDLVICFNFRTDRCREITQALTQKDFPDEDMNALEIDYATMTRYDESFKNVNVLYDKDDLKMTLGEVVSNAGLTQLRIAETEKYPHVTFFFSGGREDTFKGEKRIVINSPKVATYDLQPEM